MHKIETADDSQQRAQALDLQTSFIVQAPAGSGKTELLSQRFLTLLSEVDFPENIVALTFTRKAASEMRSRILQSLLRIVDGESAKTDYEKITFRLAKRVLIQDKRKQWALLKNPNRLRIITIDALCAHLSRQMPLLSKLDTQLSVSDDADIFYFEASRRLIHTITSNAEWVNSLKKLLLYLDNNQTKLANLFIAMLRSRDQWLAHVMQAKYFERDYLETTLKNAVTDTLNTLPAHFSTKQQDELLELLLFAANSLAASDEDSVICTLATLETFPASDITQLEAWQAIAEMLLTKNGDFRKQVSKKQGFPAPSNAKTKTDKEFYQDYKQRMQIFLEEINDNNALQTNLNELRQCPPIKYTDQQWEILQCLLDLLPVLVAQLRVVFSEHGQVDFIEIAHNARLALGKTSSPTDLALRLDYKIQHLLIDEFQDTSISQFHLLKQLTSGWQNKDGRTLFLVGDPMQSIYRFRQAEVGLFIYAQTHGIGDISLTPLTLHNNFRSNSTLIDWINHIFHKTFPEEAIIDVGAIPYSPSRATIKTSAQQAVKFYSCESTESEAQQVIKIIKNTLDDSSIVILVRARSHLQEIIPFLKQEKIDFQAHELESLSMQPVIQDLWALTRAILHPADCLAWLSILRAPWCGLSLKDLHTIAHYDQNKTILNTIFDKKLIIDGEKQLQFLKKALAHAIKQRRRQPLYQHVKNIWYQLHGPATVINQDELSNADSFFNLLQKHEIAGDLADFASFEKQLFYLFAQTNVNTDSKVQIMTMHKAKGLEFDTVIIPGLTRSSVNNKAPLLSWCERQRETGNDDLLLAPIKASDQEEDSIYKYVASLHKRREQLELSRLFYVACTRAKSSLHLLATFNKNEDNSFKKPHVNSLIASSWEHTLSDWQSALVDSNKTKMLVKKENHVCRRLSKSFLTSCDFSQTVDLETNTPKPLTDNAHDNNKRITGIFIHRFLQNLAQVGYDVLNPSYIRQQKKYWRQSLLNMGILEKNLDSCIATADNVVNNLLEDNRAEWIFSDQHTDAHNEWTLSATIDNKIKNIIIDRSFIDNKGIRWIIDYKIADSQFTDIEKEKYQMQLEEYARIIKLLENREIALGLYFPLVKGWYEWGIKKC